MDSVLHQVPERAIDHPLSLDTVLASECGAFDAQAEVAFACGIISAVPAMLLAVVDELDPVEKAPN